MSLWTKFSRLFKTPVDGDPVDLSPLQSTLGYSFQDEALLRHSLTHRSVIRSLRDAETSNERLEFLGDSILGLVIAEQLYRDHPELSEGDLTKRKAMLVSEVALSRVAAEIGLPRFIRLSEEEVASGGRERPSITSDAMEAVIASVYIDGGIDAARGAIMRCIYARREELLSDRSHQNYKGTLLELAQAGGSPAPMYDVVSETGPDHDKTFEITVTVAGRTFGTGEGASKKEAEQKAARIALEQLGHTSTE